MNTFGHIFRLTDYGESHGAAMGGIIDGCPAGLWLDKEYVAEKVMLRRPGTRKFTSPRQEADTVEWLSGISEEGLTLGSPIGFLIRNTDARSDDYEQLRHIYRPGHADFVSDAKYGLREHRGGGRASARQTLCRVVGGAVAELLLKHYDITVSAFLSGVGRQQMACPYSVVPTPEQIQESPLFAPTAEAEKAFTEVLTALQGKDSVGGRLSVIIRGLAAGIGSPVYDKLTARLAMAMMSINAARGVEFGLGMESARCTGAEAIDEYSGITEDAAGKHLHTKENRSGGIEGGISTGEDICLSVAFKPTPTRPYKVNSINDAGEPCVINPGGRHDPCVAVRAVPVAEAMAALVIADELLIARTVRL